MYIGYKLVSVINTILLLILQSKNITCRIVVNLREKNFLLSFLLYQQVFDLTICCHDTNKEFLVKLQQINKWKRFLHKLQKNLHIPEIYSSCKKNCHHLLGRISENEKSWNGGPARKHVQINSKFIRNNSYKI